MCDEGDVVLFRNQTQHEGLVVEYFLCIDVHFDISRRNIYPSLLTPPLPSLPLREGREKRERFCLCKILEKNYRFGEAWHSISAGSKDSLHITPRTYLHKHSGASELLRVVKRVENVTMWMRNSEKSKGSHCLKKVMGFTKLIGYL